MWCYHLTALSVKERERICLNGLVWWFTPSHHVQCHDNSVLVQVRPSTTTPSDVLSWLRCGWLTAIHLLLKLKEGGLVHCGPPCGSFIWINRSTSRRTRESPFGAASLRLYVRQANRILAGELICQRNSSNVFMSCFLLYQIDVVYCLCFQI